jgi:8-amino-7-oxononanoate synthase
MNLYENELRALQKAGRYRRRELVQSSLKDFASNDYLGLAHNKELHVEASETLLQNGVYSSKASMLVSGYHRVHKDFEVALCEANGFEDAVVLGSGFNANIALIDALVRKGDTLFMDELYHASGVLASQLSHKNVVFFKHNDVEELRLLLQNSNATRKIVAIEGIYSMDGDLCNKEIFEVVDRAGALLIVDEAHSSGVVGERLMGVFDHFGIAIKPHYIKMGTLGKAYGSFGAFILASSHIIEYLLNRAKPIIYATSLSLYDTLVAHKALRYILQNASSLKVQIELRQKIVFEELGIKIDGLIAPILIANNTRVMEIKEELQELGFSVGGIRQPTVKSAIIRLIARLGEDEETLRRVCRQIRAMR